MRPLVDIARKLELTSIALGCLTRKELCAAFTRANPDTAMTLQNSYNWQSGRSVPRNFSVFEDWAAAIGIAEGAHFIMSSSFAEFARVLGDTYGLPDGLLASLGPAPATATAGPAPVEAGETTGWSEAALLRGSFLALSPSWSPLQRGRLLPGALTFDTGEGSVSACYHETVLGRTIAFAGTARTNGRTCQLTLHCAANGCVYLMAFHMPPLAGNLAGGIFAGSAVYDPDAEPTGSALLLLRNHRLAPDELLAVSEYMDPDAAVLAGCLEGLGYGRDRDLVAEREILRLLEGSNDRSTVSVPRELVVRAAILLDRRRFEASGQA